MIEIDGALYRLDDILIVRPIGKWNGPTQQHVKDGGTHVEIMMRGDVWTTIEVSYEIVKDAIRQARIMAGRHG